MTTLDIVLIVSLLVCGVFLVVSVLFQSSKSEGLSGTIAGGAETFFGKDKKGRMDKMLNKLTILIGIIFTVIVLIIYIKQPDYAFRSENTSGWKAISEFASIFSK